MFAGGLRWKEQLFNSNGCIRLRVLRLGSSAVQLQSSLLSISVSAVLLPAGAVANFWPSVRSLIGVLAYHFVLRADTEDEDPTSTHLTPTILQARRNPS